VDAVWKWFERITHHADATEIAGGPSRLELLEVDREDVVCLVLQRAGAVCWDISATVESGRHELAACPTNSTPELPNIAAWLRDTV
jgi:hypothetical protein